LCRDEQVEHLLEEWEWRLDVAQREQTLNLLLRRGGGRRRGARPRRRIVFLRQGSQHADHQLVHRCGRQQLGIVWAAHIGERGMRGPEIGDQRVEVDDLARSHQAAQRPRERLL
jgi:hypothetical protein